MPDLRENQLKRWAASELHRLRSELELSSSVLDAAWQAVAGDASLRRYFRLSTPQASYICMDSPQQAGDVALFMSLANRLREAEVHAPKIFAIETLKGFLLLEDFGELMFKQLLTIESGQQLFDCIMPVLANLARCDSAELPDYSVAKLQAELDLFPQWYVAPRTGLPAESLLEDRRWQQFCRLLTEQATGQPQVLVHRDFHSCNLHRLANGEVGVIDFQDAVRGPLTYDLASWLWDRYVAWSRDDIERWTEQARRCLAPEVEPSEWIRYCDWMGLQRNLKIVGVFARLGLRDKRETYLELIPQFKQYIRDVLPRYDAFAPYRSLVDEWLA